jgi:hypothetical protein
MVGSCENGDEPSDFGATELVFLLTEFDMSAKRKKLKIHFLVLVCNLSTQETSLKMFCSIGYYFTKNGLVQKYVLVFVLMP